MDKALIQTHINTIHFCMLKLQYEYEINTINEEQHQDYVVYLKDLICDLDTIRQEYQKELDKMSKELTPLEELQFIRHFEINEDHRTLNDHVICKQSLDNIETALKAFEIIKEKYKVQKMTTYDTKGNVICDKLIAMEPNKIILNLIFTKEEFDYLLKEVLK